MDEHFLQLYLLSALFPAPTSNDPSLLEEVLIWVENIHSYIKLMSLLYCIFLLIFLTLLCLSINSFIQPPSYCVQLSPIKRHTASDASVLPSKSLLAHILMLLWTSKEYDINSCVYAESCVTHRTLQEGNIHLIQLYMKYH